MTILRGLTPLPSSVDVTDPVPILIRKRKMPRDIGVNRER